MELSVRSGYFCIHWGGGAEVTLGNSHVHQGNGTGEGTNIDQFDGDDDVK
jgi:hypothetical protein